LVDPTPASATASSSEGNRVRAPAAASPLHDDRDRPSVAPQRAAERLTAALAAELDRLTSEEPVPPRGLGVHAPGLLAALVDLGAPPAEPPTLDPEPTAERPSGSSVAPEPMSVTPPPARPRLVALRPVLVGLAVATGCVFLWLAMRPADPGASATAISMGAPRSPMASAPAAAGRGVAPAPVAAPALIGSGEDPAAGAPDAQANGATMRVVIRTKPEGARFYLDGKRMGAAPLTVDLPRGKVLRYSVWLNGYGTRVVVVDGSEREMEVGLVPASKPDEGTPDLMGER
jgi:hypothetical protein